MPWWYDRPMTPDEVRSWRVYELGISQEEAAERVGVASRTWRSWEAGDRRPPLMLSRLRRVDPTLERCAPELLED